MKKIFSLMTLLIFATLMMVPGFAQSPEPGPAIRGRQVEPPRRIYNGDKRVVADPDSPNFGGSYVRTKGARRSRGLKDQNKSGRQVHRQRLNNRNRN